MKLILLATLLFSLNAFSATTGINVESVEPGSAYAQWTLQKGDIIKQINHKEVTSLNDLMAHLGNPSAVKNLIVLRNNNEVEVKISK
ncbi:MAG: PDZ domain-containing protein [Bacteriovoracaceae bacterium]